MYINSLVIKIIKLINLKKKLNHLFYDIIYKDLLINLIIMNKTQKKGVVSLIFSIGLIILLVGALTDVYTTTTAFLIALAIWLIG